MKVVILMSCVVWPYWYSLSKRIGYLELTMQLDECTIMVQLDTKTQCKTMTDTSKPLDRADTSPLM